MVSGLNWKLASPLCDFASPLHAWDAPALLLGGESPSSSCPPTISLVTLAILSPRLQGIMAVCVHGVLELLDCDLFTL